MATFDTVIPTNAGMNLIDQEIADQIELKFTRIVFSSDDYTNTSDSDVANLTALQNQEVSADAKSFLSDGITKIRGEGYNSTLNQSYYVHTIALYGQPSNGNETLIALTCEQTPDYMPAFNGNQTSQVSYTFNLKISKTDKIDFDDNHDIPVTLDDVNKAIAPLTDDKDHNFTGKLQHNGTDVATTNDTNNAFQNAVNTMKAITVIDNHDGTVSNNGQTFAMNAPLAPCDLNNITDDGIFHSTDVMENYGDIIADVYDARKLSKFTLFVFHNDLDIYQTIYIPGMTPFYRTKYGQSWHEWQRLGGYDAADIYMGYISNFDVQALEQGTYNIQWGSSISGFGNLVTSAPNGGKLIKRWFDDNGYNGNVTLYLPTVTFIKGWTGGSATQAPTWTDTKILGAAEHTVLPTKVCDIVNLTYHYKPNSSIDIQAYFDVNTMTVHLDGWVNGGDQNVGIQIDADTIYSMLGQNKPVYISGYSTNGSTGVWEDTLRGNKVIDRTNGIVVGIGAAGKFYWDNVTINLAFTN